MAITYLEYGEWDKNVGITYLSDVCAVCGEKIGYCQSSWTVEYSDGDIFHFHHKCIAARMQAALDYIEEYSHAVSGSGEGLKMKEIVDKEDFVVHGRPAAERRVAVSKYGCGSYEIRIGDQLRFLVSPREALGLAKELLNVLELRAQNHAVGDSDDSTG